MHCTFDIKTCKGSILMTLDMPQVIDAQKGWFASMINMIRPAPYGYQWTPSDTVSQANKGYHPWTASVCVSEPIRYALIFVLDEI